MDREKQRNTRRENDMDRDKIIKALECCILRATCVPCPYRKVVGCIRKRESDSLDLIRDLMAENESVRADTVRDVMIELSAMIGTYQTDSVIRVADVFKMLSSILKEMLEED